MDNKTFDELFNEFFKRNKINPDDFLHDSLRDEAKKMIDMLSSFRDMDSIDEDLEKQMDESLGEPDEVLRYKEGGMYFEKRIWHTPTGDLIKLTGSDIPLEMMDAEYKKPVTKKSLQKKLNEALADENYEEAAKIRDEMEQLGKNKDKK